MAYCSLYGTTTLSTTTIIFGLLCPASLILLGAGSDVGVRPHLSPLATHHPSGRDTAIGAVTICKLPPSRRTYHYLSITTALRSLPRTTHIFTLLAGIELCACRPHLSRQVGDRRSSSKPHPTIVGERSS